MAKKKAPTESKAASKAAKKAKADVKNAKNEVKSVKGKGKAAGKADEEDLEAILASVSEYALLVAGVFTHGKAFPTQFQDDWKAAHTVTEEVQSGAPSRRVNATFTAYGDHLWLIGGEYFDGGKAYFYNDTFRYSPDKNEWRAYTCPTAPAPRSAHSVVPIAKDGGQLWLFGGEYASQSQTTFHHYRDLWVFSIKDHTWEKVETKTGPTARSGHRMALWKQFIVLFGGFHDLGVRTTYLSDLWLFDTETYKWKQVEIRDTDRMPGARSGFSMLPCAEGVVVYGGYRKEYTKGSKPVGVALEDTWVLHMDQDLTKIKWERKKKAGYAPTLRSGCSMTLWPAKGMGVLFGGVADEEEDDDIKSVFYNDMYAYNLANNKWSSLNIQHKKKRGGNKAKRKAADASADTQRVEPDGDIVMTADDADSDDEEEAGATEEDQNMATITGKLASAMDVDSKAAEEEDPLRPMAPLTRYSAMLAVSKNTLYIYGGVHETEQREYTLDDFYTLNLEKRDGFVTLRASGIDEEAWFGSDDEDEQDEDGDDGSSSSDDDEGDEFIEEKLDEHEQGEDRDEAAHAALTAAEKEALRQKATQFLGSTKNADRPHEEVMSTPLPGETLRLFFDRSREYWVMLSHETSDSRGKTLRREGFVRCEAKYAEYKPILLEIERIQVEAEVEAADSKKAAGKVTEGNRNRR